MLTIGTCGNSVSVIDARGRKSFIRLILVRSRTVCKGTLVLSSLTGSMTDHARGVILCRVITILGRLEIFRGCCLSLEDMATTINSNSLYLTHKTLRGSIFGASATNVGHLKSAEIKGSTCTLCIIRLLSATSSGLLGHSELTNLSSVKPEIECTIYATKLICMVLVRIKITGCKYTIVKIFVGYLIISIVRFYCRTVICGKRAFLNHTKITVIGNINVCATKSRGGAHKGTNCSSNALDHNFNHPSVRAVQRNGSGKLHCGILCGSQRTVL